MNKFAKLFESEQLGQLVVFNQVDEDDKPEVRVFFTAEGLGVSSMALGFPDTEDGQNKADTVFEKMTSEYWESLVGKALINLEII